MNDTFHQQRLTNLLQSSSRKLDELLCQVHPFEQGTISAELLDELAVVTGELMLVLMEYQPAHGSEELVQEVISHAQKLREHLRSGRFRPEQISQAVDSFTQEVETIIRDSKLAA